jgi:predicted phage-related endonuclease
MKILKFENRDQWLLDRKGKITGSTLGSIVNKTGVTKDMIVKELEAQKVEFKKTAKKEELEVLLTPEQTGKLESQLEKKTGFYQLIAERLMVSEEDFEGYVPNETPMDRGTRLQRPAIDHFTTDTGKKVDDSLVLWMRSDNNSIAVSPDGTVIGEPAAVEAKCLSAAHHVEAYLTKEVPEDYKYQVRQYFVVNDKLETLYFLFYDPRMPAIQFFYLTIKREDIEESVRKLLAYQLRELAEVDDIVAKLTNF